MAVTSFRVLRGMNQTQTLGTQRQTCCVSEVDMVSLQAACPPLADTKIPTYVYALH